MVRKDVMLAQKLRNEAEDSLSFLRSHTSTIHISELKKCQMKAYGLGHLGGSVVKCLPLAQGMIPRSWDRVQHQAPCRKPASPSACVSAFLSVSLMNKKIKTFKKRFKED